MSRSLRKYLKQRVLDLHDGTALPSNVQSPSQRCACSLHNTFTESSTSLLCFYFNNQRSQSSTSSLLIFQITVTFSKQVVQSSGCIALQVSIALLKCNGFGISLFCKNTFPDFFFKITFAVLQDYITVTFHNNLAVHSHPPFFLFLSHFQTIGFPTHKRVTIACYGHDLSYYTPYFSVHHSCPLFQCSTSTATSSFLIFHANFLNKKALKYFKI